MKKITSILLVIIIIMGGFPMKTGATDVVEQSILQESIYYTDLFYGYSYYLINETYLESYTNEIENIYESVYSSYENSPLLAGTGLEYALDTITSPTDVAQLITDTLGLTNFSYNDALDAANEDFVRNLLSNSIAGTVGEAYGKTADSAKMIKELSGCFDDLIKLSESGETVESAEDYVRAAVSFMKNKGYLENISDSMFTKLWTEINAQDFTVQSCFKLASTEIEIAQALMIALMMEDMRIEVVDGIIASQTSNTVLKQGMTRLRSKLQGNFATYFIYNYLINQAANQILKVMDDCALEALDATGIAAIIKLCKMVFNQAVDVPKYADVLKWQVLQCYSRDLHNGISLLADSYDNGIFLSDKIFEYENLFIAYNAVNLSAMEITENIANMGNPYGEAYTVLLDAVNNNIATVTIKTGTIKASIPSDMTDEEFYRILSGEQALVVEGVVVDFDKVIEISNGKKTVKVPLKANCLASIVKGCIDENQILIYDFQNKYADKNLYDEHIKSAREEIIKTPVSERKLLSKDVYSNWKYTLDASTKIENGSNSVKQGCYYTVDGLLLGNAYSSDYVVPTGLHFGVAGNLDVNAWGSLTISTDSSLEVKGDFWGNAWAYSDAYRSEIKNYGIFKVCGKSYGYGNFKGNGKYIMNYVSPKVYVFYDATYEIWGNVDANVECNGARIILAGNDSTIATLKGTARTLDVFSTNLTLTAPSISEYIDFHGNNVTLTNTIYILSGATPKAGSNYKRLYFPERHILKNDIESDYMEFKLGVTASAGKYTLKGQIKFWPGADFIIIEDDAELCLDGDATGMEWRLEPVRTTVINSGIMTTTGNLYGRYTLQGDGIYNIDNIAGQYITLKSGQYNIRGNTAYAIEVQNISSVNLCGTQAQTVGFSGAIQTLNITNQQQVTFSAPLNISTLFNHQGNSFYLYNSGYGSSFVDYDGDGMKDNVDPQPTVGNPCVITVQSENLQEGTVSTEKIECVGGTKVTVKAEPTYKYYFSKWINASGNTVSTSPEYTFVVKTNETLTAVFEKRSQIITKVSEGGTIQAPSSAIIESQVNATVTENTGYMYVEDSLKYNGIVIENNSFIMPDEAVVLTAEFVRNDNYFILEEAIKQAETYNSELYSKESFAILSQAISEARVNIHNYISQESKDIYCKGLQDAIDGLSSRYVVQISFVEEPTFYINVSETIKESQLLISYSNDTTQVIQGSECVVTGFDAGCLGEQEIKINYQGYEEAFVVRVLKRSIQDCEAYCSPCVIQSLEDVFTPDPTITYLSTREQLVLGRDYVLSYANNTVPLVGKPTIYITGIGDYVGETSITFNIYCYQHMNDEWKIEQEATPEQDGVASCRCLKCNYITEESFPYLQIGGAGVTLYDNVSMKCVVDGDIINSSVYSNVELVWEFNGQTTVINKEDVYMEIFDWYFFQMDDITPDQMTDTMYYTLRANIGDQVISTEPRKYSIQEYFEYVLNELQTNEDEKLHKLCVDTLNYGAAAQLYTGHATDRLANSILSETDKTFASPDIESFNNVFDPKYATVENPTAKWKGAELVLDEGITMKFTLEAEDVTNLCAKICTDEGEIAVINASDFVKCEDNKYYVYFSELIACQMSESIYLTVYDGDTAVSNTVRYSVESYVYAMSTSSDEKLRNLVNGLMKYGNSAYEYAN